MRGNLLRPQFAEVPVVLPDLPTEEMWEAGLSVPACGGTGVTCTELPPFFPGILPRSPFLFPHRGKKEMTDGIPSYFPWKRYVKNNARLH